MEDARKKKPGQNWGDYVEQQIREAVERGEFDNLQGKGRPQEFVSYHGDPTLEMANKVVRDAGFVPAWIEQEREIEREQKEAEDALLRSWRWRETVRSDAIEDPQWVAGEWRKARESFEKKLKAINSKILTLNLQLPMPMAHKQRPRLRIESEFEKLGIENE